MKTLKIACTLCVALLLLAGCRRSELAQNIGAELDGWRVDHDASFMPPGQPSDIVQLENSDFTEELNFSITAPETEVLRANKFYAVDGWFGQIEYTADVDGMDEAWPLVLRIARETSPGLAGTYTETHLRGDTVDVGGTEVLYSAADRGCTALSWAKDGFQFYLHSHNPERGVPADIVETLVTGLSGVDYT